MAGVVEEGGALQAVTSITDADGAVSLSYQWQSSSDEVTWVDLVGANAASYTIPSDQSLVGEYLRLSVVSTDPLGGATTFISGSNLVEPARANWEEVGDLAGSYTPSRYYTEAVGYSVSLSRNGSIVAVGSPFDYPTGPEDTVGTGVVRIYRKDSGALTQIGGDIDGENSLDFFGSTVSLNSDGTIVAIGALGNDSNGVDAGHVRIYRNDSGAWVQIGEDIHGKDASDRFGSSISLSSDGLVLAVGSDEGVRVYQSISGSWAQIGEDVVAGISFSLSLIHI